MLFRNTGSTIVVCIWMYCDSYCRYIMVYTLHVSSYRAYWIDSTNLCGYWYDHMTMLVMSLISNSYEDCQSSWPCHALATHEPRHDLPMNVDKSVVTNSQKPNRMVNDSPMFICLWRKGDPLNLTILERSEKQMSESNSTWPFKHHTLILTTLTFKLSVLNISVWLWRFSKMLAKAIVTFYKNIHEDHYAVRST